MALFGLGLGITLVNFLQTIARRQTREIYISNWYIVSALLFTLTIVGVAYWPTWQNGLGETIIQGYYMHQGVGMWFMLFNLGLVYCFLPQQLNKPIYSYSLGILAFWTQILFYTLIGTHHFVFSSIPWWLQTAAIVGSVGMLIPVAAGTTNFLMTFRGMWHKVGSSYTLPFYVVGIVFYFTGSFQGTAEAFRYTNLRWHFTDFTVAHSHLTMYGIITFLLWASLASSLRETFSPCNSVSSVVNFKKGGGPTGIPAPIQTLSPSFVPTMARRAALRDRMKKSVARVVSLVFLLIFPYNLHCIGLFSYPFHQRQVYRTNRRTVPG